MSGPSVQEIPRHAELVLAFEESRQTMPGESLRSVLKAACELAACSPKEMGEAIGKHFNPEGE